MTRHPPATVEVIDVEVESNTIFLLCRWNKSEDRSSSVVLEGWFDHDRHCGIDGVVTDMGDDLIDHLPAELCRMVLHYCIDFFDAEQWLRDHLSETNQEEGKIFRSPQPPDHDALAKEQRMLNEERNPDAKA